MLRVYICGSCVCVLSCKLMFPYLQAPSSLLEALEQHLASLEGKKVKDSTAASRYCDFQAVNFELSRM